MRRISDEELLEEIHHLADELGHPPTLQEYRDHGEFGATTYYDRFGSWQNALKEAGFEPREPQAEIPDEELIEEIQRLADELGEQPSVLQMNKKGKYWVSTYRNHFGSWGNALEAAGFKAPSANTSPGDGSTGPPVSDKELVAEIQRLADELDRRPTWDDMAEEGKHSPTTYVRRFGSWADGLKAAGFDVPGAAVTQEELLDELRRLADELGRAPTMQEMNDKGKHSPNTYVDWFGSWSAAKAAAFDEDH